MVKKSNKRILVICPFSYPNLGGVESHIDKLLKFGSKKDYYMILLTYQPLTRNIKGEKLEKTTSYEIHRVSWFGVGLFPKLENYFPLMFIYLVPGLFVKSLVYFAKNHKSIHCIHAHGLAAGFITRCITIFSKTRTVISTHAVYNFSNRKLLGFLVKAILNGFDVILGVSEVSKNEIIKLGINKKKVGVHPNWVEMETFISTNKQKACENLNLKYTFNTIYIGRLLEKKGIKLIIDAAKNLPNVSFNFAGNGPLEDYIVQVAKKYDNINYYGVLMQHNKKELNTLLQLYSASDVLLQPYLYDEGFSATLIESVAMETPPVITNRGSPPTFLSKECAIFLSKNPTAKELHTKIQYFVDNPKELQKIRLNCRPFAENHFGYKNAEVITDSYEEN